MDNRPFRAEIEFAQTATRDGEEIELVYWDSLHGRDVIFTIRGDVECDLSADGTIERASLSEVTRILRTVVRGE